MSNKREFNERKLKENEKNLDAKNLSRGWKFLIKITHLF